MTLFDPKNISPFEQDFKDWKDSIDSGAGGEITSDVIYYVDPLYGSDEDGDGTLLSPFATVTAAAALISPKIIKADALIEVLNSGTDILPRTLYLRLQNPGTFALRGGILDPTILFTATYASHSAGLSCSAGYATTRLSYTAPFGYPDNSGVGRFLLIPDTGVQTYAGYLFPIFRSGTDWIEVIAPYSASDDWTGDHNAVIPAVTLTQSQRFDIVVYDEQGPKLLTSGSQATNGSNVVFSNFSLSFTV